MLVSLVSVYGLIYRKQGMTTRPIYIPRASPTALPHLYRHTPGHLGALLAPGWVAASLRGVVTHSLGVAGLAGYLGAGGQAGVLEHCTYLGADLLVALLVTHGLVDVGALLVRLAVLVVFGRALLVKYWAALLEPLVLLLRHLRRRRVN